MATGITPTNPLNKAAGTPWPLKGRRKTARLPEQARLNLIGNHPTVRPSCLAQTPAAMEADGSFAAEVRNL